jgi:ElaB/YqjD/DUF883 family membrane-anchored ribosome-binding protein
VSFLDFNPYSYFVEGGTNGSDFGVDQITQTAMNQMSKTIADILSSYTSTNKDLLSTLRNNVLTSIGKYRNNFTMSLTGKVERSTGKVSEIQSQIGDANRQLENIGISVGAGAGFGLYGALESFLASYYEGVGERAGQIAIQMEQYFETHPWVQQGSRVAQAYEEYAGRYVDRTVLNAAEILGAAESAAAIGGVAVALGAAIAIYAGIELNIGELAVEMQDFYQLMKEDHDNIEQMESEIDVHFVEGEWQDNTRSAEVIAAIGAAIAGGSANLQSSLMGFVNDWLASVGTKYGGADDEGEIGEGLLGLIGGGFGGLF